MQIGALRYAGGFVPARRPCPIKMTFLDGKNGDISILVDTFAFWRELRSCRLPRFTLQRRDRRAAEPAQAGSAFQRSPAGAGRPPDRARRKPPKPATR